MTCREPHNRSQYVFESVSLGSTETPNRIYVGAHQLLLDIPIPGPRAHELSPNMCSTLPNERPVARAIVPSSASTYVLWKMRWWLY